MTMNAPHGRISPLADYLARPGVTVWGVAEVVEPDPDRVHVTAQNIIACARGQTSPYANCLDGFWLNLSLRGVIGLRDKHAKWCRDQPARRTPGITSDRGNALSEPLGRRAYVTCCWLSR